MLYKFLWIKNLILFIIYNFFLIFTKLLVAILVQFSNSIERYSRKIFKNVFINYLNRKVKKYQSILLGQNLKDKNNINKSINVNKKDTFDDSIIIGSHHTWNKFKFSSILISTKTDIERLNSTKKHLKDLDIKYLNHQAVTHKTLKNVLLEETTLVSKSKVSQISCFVSHIFAIDQILKSKTDETFLILEDDVRLFPDPHLVGLDNIINNKDWDIVTFEHHMPYTFQRLSTSFNHGNLLQRWDNPKDYGASAYLITRDFAKKIVNYFLVDTSEGIKIDLKKTYIFHREIVPDYLLFDLGNTLISTFPLALQNPDFLSEIGYKNYQDMMKRSAIDEVTNLWKKFYIYD